MSAVPDPVAAAESPRALAEVNRWLAGQTAQQRVAWALHTLTGTHALSSSFGVQAAVSLHLVTQQAPRTPVILIDTGYPFPETHRFAGELSERLALNLKIYRPRIASDCRRHGSSSCANVAAKASRSTTACTRSNRCSVRWTRSA